MPIPIRRAPATLMACAAPLPAIHEVLERIPVVPAAGHAEQTPFEQET